MIQNMNRKTVQYILLTVGFYLAIALLIFGLSKSSRSGPCDVPVWMLILIALPVVSFILAIVSLVKLSNGKTWHRIPLIIHILVLIGFGAVWFYTTYARK
jgi:uncharacterized Tic20 family protein